MTNQPKPPEKIDLDPAVKKRKDERKKLLEGDSEESSRGTEAGL
jgi:hypothetical protein